MCLLGSYAYFDKQVLYQGKNLCGRKSLVNQQRDMLVLGACFPRRCCGSWKDFQVLAECILTVSPLWQASFLPPTLSPRPHPNQSVLSSKDCTVFNSTFTILTVLPLQPLKFIGPATWYILQFPK